MLPKLQNDWLTYMFTIDVPCLDTGESPLELALARPAGPNLGCLTNNIIALVHL